MEIEEKNGLADVARATCERRLQLVYPVSPIFLFKNMVGKSL